MKCDLNCLEELLQMNLPTCDIFYHLGWMGTIGNSRNDTILQNKNIRNALAAVDVAKKLGCHTFIGAGSQAEYGRVEGILTPAMPTHPETGYGIAKLCAGMMTRLKCAQVDMRHIWIRILSVYGPYDGQNTMVMSTIHKLLVNEIPQTTKGEQEWDYLYSSDAGHAFYLAGKYGKNEAVYCLGSGRAKPLIEYINEIKDEINPAADIQVGTIPYYDKQVMYLCADISDLSTDTGFIPEISFKEGIHNTVVWYQKFLLERKHEND